MPTYVILSNFTDEGIKGIKDTVKRSEALREGGKVAGVGNSGAEARPAIFSNVAVRRNSRGELQGR